MNLDKKFWYVQLVNLVDILRVVSNTLLRALLAVGIIVGISSICASDPMKLYVFYLQLLPVVMTIYILLFCFTVLLKVSIKAKKYIKIVFLTFLEYFLSVFVFSSLVDSTGVMSEKAFDVWLADEVLGKIIVIAGIVVVMSLLVHFLKKWISSLENGELLILDHTIIPENSRERENNKPVEYHYKIKNSWLTLSQSYKV